jgi:hypothetical protein
MPKGPFILLLLSCLTTTMAFAGGDLNITNSTGRGQVVIEWVGVDESGVSGYEILRRDWGNNPEAAISLTTIPVDPSRQYRFEDKTLFRTMGKVFVYTVRPVGAGKDKEKEVSIIFEGVSGVRRTWGSIKAMFR